MARAGFVDHIGIGVPDLLAAKEYYDDLMPRLGLHEWFQTSPELNYGPDGALGTQVFFYESLEPNSYSRHGIGLQHLAFIVSSREVVDEAHAWATARDAEIIHAPRGFPEYGDHYATYFLDPHGFMLEVVCHEGDGG